jgi:hypothetical protein
VTGDHKITGTNSIDTSSGMKEADKWLNKETRATNAMHAIFQHVYDIKSSNMFQTNGNSPSSFSYGDEHVPGLNFQVVGIGMG